MPESMCLKCGRWISYEESEKIKQPRHCLNCGESLDKPKKFIILSKAYLEASELLCSQMSDGALPQEYVKSCVILFLAHHSVELFLKGAILKKKANEELKKIHCIYDLKSDYDILYSGGKYKLEVPFCTKYPGPAKEDIQSLKKFPLDQIYRYPVDTEGEEWNGVFGFTPNTFLKELKRLKSEFDKLGKEIFTE
jgi:hypothetical protein